MPKQAKRLTEKRLRALRPGAWVADAAVPGFGARRHQSRTMFVLRYEWNGKRTVRVIGEWADFDSLLARPAEAFDQEPLYDAKETLARAQRGESLESLLRVVVNGGVPLLTLDEAREVARMFRGEISRGRLPDDKNDSRFKAVAKDFIARYAKKNKTWAETERLLNTYVLPQWGSRAIADIRRRDVHALLNEIEDGTLKVKIKNKERMVGGPTTADRVLAAIRKLFNWYATTDDDFVSPVVIGMARTKQSERARKRILSDDEIRALWTATEIPGEAGGLDPYCAAVRALLLTAQRRTKVSLMRRSAILDDVRVPAGDGKEMVMDRVWCPADDDDGENKQVGVVPLPESVHAMLMAQPALGEDDPEHEEDSEFQDWIFTRDGKRPINSWSEGKAELDARMLLALRERAVEAGEDAEKVTLRRWVHHDLRRTAKTLMTRAGVRPDISERVLGHVIPGVEGVYDRWEYAPEKKEALETLATLVERIINPPADNVVAIKRA